MEELKPNLGKNDIIVVDGVSYQRLPIHTHLITDQDNILDVAEQYGSPVLTEPEDILFISEKCVACTQKRAIPIFHAEQQIHPCCVVYHVKRVRILL